MDATTVHLGVTVYVQIHGFIVRSSLITSTTHTINQEKNNFYRVVVIVWS